MKKARSSTVRSPVRAFLTGLFAFTLSALPAEAAQVVLVPTGSTWKYLDNGSDQKTSWRSKTFNDSSWRSGPAQLGYGDGDEATLTAQNKITTYFRHSFSVADKTGMSNLTVKLLRDDGAVVYLNGTEVFRSNMPSGSFNYRTLASSSVEPPAESTFYTAAVSLSPLVKGTNVLAVEVHQSSATNPDLSFDLELSVTVTPVGTALLRAPYVQRGTPGSMVVRWRTDASTDSLVRYGLSTADLSASAYNATLTAEHEVTLSGLTADTRYYYSAGSSTQTLAGGDANHTFVTSPAGGKPTRIWVLGDSGMGTSSQVAVRDAYFNFNGTRPTDVWLMLGDNAYVDGTDAEFTTTLFNMYPTVLRQTPLWPTFGNHDATSSDSSTQSGPYYVAFTLPRNAEAGGVASGTEAYYSFNYGNVHFICLDSSQSSRSVTGPMMTWLRNDLAANNRDWNMAFFHHPPYSKGAVDSDGNGTCTDMRENALPSMEDAGIDLVLAGHNHIYQRSWLIDGHYGTSNTFTESMKIDGGDGREDGNGAYHKPFLGPAPHQGTVYIIAGSSGGVSSQLVRHAAMYTVQGYKGSLVLDIDGGRLDAAFITDTGAIRDHFTIIKGSSSVPPPEAPTGLTAGAASATKIVLGWTDNSTTESGFKVERSTDGSTFLQIASLAQNATSHSDTTVSPSTTYYYRVLAFNSGGNSDYSSTESATTPAAPPVSSTLPAAGSVWKYLANGSDQGTAWRATGFDDSSWASGPAQLGYGDGDEATVVGYGPDPNHKYITTYFRHAFNVDDTSYTSLTLGLLRDDGGVVYLNGVEVFRSNMPTVTITYTTPSATTTSDESTFFETAVSPSLLVAGINVLAVEIHQANGGSSDISFDLRLTGTR